MKKGILLVVCIGFNMLSLAMDNYQRLVFLGALHAAVVPEVGGRHIQPQMLQTHRPNRRLIRQSKYQTLKRNQPQRCHKRQQ